MSRSHTLSDMEDDFNEFQPCFFKNDMGEENFYDEPAPSENIWKKFELLTPPRSPKHEALLSEEDLIPAGLIDMERVWDLFGDPLGISQSKVDTVIPGISDIVTELDSALGITDNAVIQDCMWSGFTIPQEQSQKSTSIKSSTGVGENTVTSLGAEINASTECVDPAAVFPYPLSATRVDPLSLGTETPSDSDEEDDEEIDVVTVADKTQISRRRPILPGSSSMSAQVAAMHNYTQQPPKTHHVTHRSTANAPVVTYKRPRHAGPSQGGGRDSGGRPPIKKLKISLPHSNADLRTVVQKLKSATHNHHSRSSCGSRSSSDSEDSEGRRAQHNVLERKRRNDLKSSFLNLRDSVPELQAQEKAAKVVILRKATEYIMDLRADERRMLTELDRQKQIHERLRRRLSVLQRNH